VGRERGNVQPALSKPQRRENRWYRQAHEPDALIMVYTVIGVSTTQGVPNGRLYNMASDETDGAETSRENGPILDRRILR
jgi:hypothetical protein